MPQGDDKPRSPEVGDKIGGKYELIRKIAEGGGGVVWKAANPNGGFIALKFLKWSSHDQRKVAAERFKNEFAILKSLSHPNIAQIHDFGIDTATGLYFFTSEFLTAGDLKDMIGSPIIVIENLLLQSLRVLEYLRANKLLHLDIKPSNLLLRNDGSLAELALIDFGLAAFSPPDTPGGTPNYMPPELIVRRLGLLDQFEIYPQPDHRSDLYSLGVSFYYCLTGMHPFAVSTGNGKRADQEAILCKHLKYAPPPPSSFRPDIPDYLNQIIMRLMARHPDDRYPSAIVAAQALQYRSPNDHVPESQKTLLAYLPKEGKLIGRHAEQKIIEQSLKDFATGKLHHTPIICIAGNRGLGRTRLIKSIKPLAQQQELECYPIEAQTESFSSVFSTIMQTCDTKKHVILIDGLEEYLLKENGEIQDICLLINQLKLSQKLKSTPGSSIFFIFTVNTEIFELSKVQKKLGLNETVCHTLGLKNFTRSEMGEYLGAVLGETPDATVVEQLSRCTAGNPLFVSEHLEEMIAKGRLFSLAGRPDAKTLKAIGIDFSQNPPPKSLADVIKEKLIHLPDEAGHAALMMACFGRPVSIGELNAALGTKTASHEMLLLVSSELARKEGKEGRFTFANELMPGIVIDNAKPNLTACFHDAIATLLRRHKKNREEIDLHLAYGSNKISCRTALLRLVSRAETGHDYLHAAKHLERLLALTTARDLETHANILARLGNIYEKARHFEKARANYKKLNALKAPIDAKLKFRIKASEQLGLLYLRHRHLKDARKFFTEAIHLIGSKPSLLMWRLKLENCLASVDLREGRLEDAISRFECTSTTAKKKLSRSKRLAITNNELGHALLRKGDARRALTILKSQLREAIDAKNTNRIANCHYLIADALRHDSIHNYQEAASHYYEALKMAREEHIIELSVRVLNGLGNLHLKKFEPEKAMACYHEGLKLAQQIEGEITGIELMIGMGLAAQQMGRPDNTIEYLEAAADFVKGPRGSHAGLIRRFAPTIYVSLGDAYYQIHDFTHAVGYLNQALAMDKRTHLSLDVRYSLYGTFTEIYIAQGNFDAAKNYLPILGTIAKNFPPSRAHYTRMAEKIAVGETLTFYS